MRYRKLGKSGIFTSVIGLGTNRFGSPKVPYEEVERILLGAIDCGVNLIDTADYYQKGHAEEYIGKALAGNRDKVILASKFYYEVGEGPNDRGTSRYHMMNSLEKSLARLRTDHIDLYYIHRWDPATPIQETLRALDDCVRDGKLRFIGASSFAAWQLARANLQAETNGWSPFVVLQSHYHMFERKVEKDVLTYCREYGVGFIPYYPLAGGFLTGKYRKDQPAPSGSRGETNCYVRKYLKPPFFNRLEQLEEWVRQKGHTPTDLALAWLLAQPSVCAVIPGASTLEQFQASLGAADWELSPRELQEVGQIISGAPEIHHDLGKRLGIKAGMQAALINHPDDYPDILGDLPEDVVLKKNLSGAFIFIQLFARTEEELAHTLPKAVSALQPGGLLWITYPVGTTGENEGVNQFKVREMCSGLALSESRQVQVDDIWTAMAFKKIQTSQ